MSNINRANVRQTGSYVKKITTSVDHVLDAGESISVITDEPIPDTVSHIYITGQETFTTGSNVNLLEFQIFFGDLRVYARGDDNTVNWYRGSIDNLQFLIDGEFLKNQVGNFSLEILNDSTSDLKVTRINIFLVYPNGRG